MANANRGLGKGLGALLGDAALRTDTSDNPLPPISQIEPYANQPRRHFDEEVCRIWPIPSASTALSSR